VSANGEALDAEAVRRILAANPRFNVPASVQKKLKLNKDVVYKQEVDMKFEVKITRVQVATSEPPQVSCRSHVGSSSWLRAA